LQSRLASDEELKTYMATHQIETLSAAIKSLLDDEHRLNNQLSQANERPLTSARVVREHLPRLRKGLISLTVTCWSC
jgi:hypothetical protein